MISRCLIVFFLAALVVVANGANLYTVFAGAASLSAPSWGLEAFYPNNITVQVGDQIQFVVQAGEHTVSSVFFNTTTSSNGLWFDSQTFALVPGAVQQGGLVVNTTTPVSSGLMHVGDSITYTFTEASTYTMYCAVHSATMFITITVTTAAAPMTPTQLATTRDQMVNTTVAQLAVLETQQQLRNQTPAVDTTANSNSRTFHVRIGGGSAALGVSFLSYIPSNVTIAIGDSIIFVNNDPVDLHMVCMNSTNIFQSETLNSTTLNPVWFSKTGTPGNFVGGVLSSGLIGQTGTFVVTFNTLGTFMIMDIHEPQVVGFVIVQQSSTATATATPTNTNTNTNNNNTLIPPITTQSSAAVSSIAGVLLLFATLLLFA